MKLYTCFIMTLMLVMSCTSEKPQKVEQVVNEYPDGFPYGNVPREKPNMPLSAAMERVQAVYWLQGDEAIYEEVDRPTFLSRC